MISTHTLSLSAASSLDFIIHEQSCSIVFLWPINFRSAFD